MIADADQQLARSLVYPIASTLRSLDWYLRRVRRGDGRGELVVETIRTLERCERLARSMFTPTVAGL